MSSYNSPRTPGSTPGREWEYARMTSATPTPSPQRAWYDTTPRRPATRATHTRASSYSQQASFTPRPARDSPRYNSSGEYATVDVSANDFSSSRRLFHPSPSSEHHPPPRRSRRSSYTYVRASTPVGESDEDEIIETLSGTYVLPAQSWSSGPRHSYLYPGQHDAERYTNHHGYKQSSSQQQQQYYPYDYDYPAAYTPSTTTATPTKTAAPSVHQSPRVQQSPRVHQQETSSSSRHEKRSSATPQSRPPTSQSHSRRSSTSVPQRSATARPSTASNTAAKSSTQSSATHRKANDADAKLHKIPTGYSLKNWDPKEQPILLLGSVFDANSLGKWIYDWTVYREGPVAPISDMAGELWLLLIQLSAKIKRAEEIVGRVRSKENKELMNTFLDSGVRLMDKLRSLLKACEAPMLKVAKKRQTGLGKNSGVEFVDTLFGVDREGPRTDKFMQGVRLFNLRFDANCEDILQNPTI